MGSIERFNCGRSYNLAINLAIGILQQIGVMTELRSIPIYEYSHCS
jgi:hypothetical protein